MFRYAIANTLPVSVNPPGWAWQELRDQTLFCDRMSRGDVVMDSVVII